MASHAAFTVVSVNQPHSLDMPRWSGADRLASLPPDAVGAFVILRPIHRTTPDGTRAGFRGAVVVFSRTGGA